MFDLPDKRAIFIFIAIGVMVAIDSLASPNTSFANATGKFVDLSILCAGAAFVRLDLKEGYCMNRPSVTRVESPFFFWVEVTAATAVAFMGALKLIRSF